ncbi:Nucleotide-binding universal stress protein, UspA family [Variovorax sp. OK605]|uniref:universal stress protein n=1 Tax=Variovorax sp. OK605 TaxID=1855317 RepID=UPI0008E4C364|nr:universal stress protein [Variovorax sp. OK605]SFQ59960.1 Nucleotide-binding universal stress protein, UspA family [Variovorax sp. OK605]
MQYPTILVHLDRTERTPRCSALAIGWARAYGAHLIGLVPTGFQGSTPSAGLVPGAMARPVSDSQDCLRGRAEAISSEFRAAIAVGGPLSCEVRLVDGDTGDAVVRHGRASDLIVLGQSDRPSASDASVRALPAHVLMEVGRPVLLVPSDGRFEGPPRRILVGWDGSREAAVALHAALPALRCALRVTLASYRYSDAPRHVEAQAWRLALADTLQFLQRHGIRARAEREITALDIGEALLSRAVDLDADLLVMGAYGHSRLRERFLGGVTQQVFAQMTMPVLVAH